MENELENTQANQGPAPKIEKISLSELRAENIKIANEEQALENEKLREQVAKFADKYAALSPEERKAFAEYFNKKS